MKPPRSPKSPFFLWTGLFVFSLILSLCVGAGEIAWGEVLTFQPGLSSSLFWKLRFPRVLAAGAVGAGLALVGAVLQSSLRNPLADPFLLGVSSASATGAVAALAIGWSSGRFGLSVGAALICLLCLDRLAYRRGVFSNHVLLIGGVAITYLLSATTGLIVALADSTKTRGLLFWLMGGFSSLEPVAAGLCIVSLIFTGGYLLKHARELDILATGDESAHVLGLRPDGFRRKLFFVCSVVVGVCVATAGGIGFVGLLVPHLARIFCGVTHRQLLPLCVVGGATLTILADFVARTVVAPREIPVGLLTALLGAPFFLYQLRKGGGWS